MSENPPVALMLLPLPLVVGSVIGVVVGFATSSWLWAIVALVVAAMTIGAVAFLVAESLALRLLKARPLAAGGSLALRNQLEELCARTGLAEPELYTVGSGAPAIASVGRVSSALVVTDGLTDDLTVVELEAAVARELGRIQSGRPRSTHWLWPSSPFRLRFSEGWSPRRCDSSGVATMMPASTSMASLLPGTHQV